jgi:hypothetical protein
MRQYRIIARILLSLPIIHFAFALPIAVQEASQLCGDVVPEVAMTMSAKRGDETENQSDVYFENLFRNPDSSLTVPPPSGSEQSESDHAPMNRLAPPQSSTSSTAPDSGSMDPPQMSTSEIQQVSSELMTPPSLGHVAPPELSKSPILGNYMVPTKLSKFPILEHYMAQPELSKSPILEPYMVPPESWKSPTLESYVVPPELSKPSTLEPSVVPPESKPMILEHYTVPPMLSNFPILEHYMAPAPELSKSPPLDDQVVPEPSESPILDDHVVVSTNSESGPSQSTASESGWSMSSSSMEEPESKSFLSKVFSIAKFWRRTSGPGFVGKL